MAKNKQPSQRQLQAGEVIRRILVDVIARENFRDPDLFDISITISEVQASPDLKHARVYALPLGGANVDNVIAALNRCAKFLRGKLGQELSMRSTPALQFLADTSFQTASDTLVGLDRLKEKEQSKNQDSET